MKKVLFLLLLVHQGWAQSALPVQQISDSTSTYNRSLHPGEMKQDLQLFLDIRKKTNSGLYRYRSQQQTVTIPAPTWLLS